MMSDVTSSDPYYLVFVSIDMIPLFSQIFVPCPHFGALGLSFGSVFLTLAKRPRRHQQQEGKVERG